MIVLIKVIIYINNNFMTIYIAKWKHAKWLVLSSLLFTIPSFYAYHNKLYFYSTLLFFISLISVNYWRKATYSWRRNM